MHAATSILVLSLSLILPGLPSNMVDGIHKNMAGRAVASKAHQLAREFASQHDLSAWVASNGTFGGQNSFDYVGSVAGLAGLIPNVNLQDGPQGVRNTLGCCTTNRKLHSYPAAAAIGSAWSPDFAYHHAKFGVQDWVDVGANSALLPGTDVHRLPTFGRSWEYVSGEDAALGSLVGDLVKGIQSKNVLPAVKHFAFNHQELNRGQGILTGNIAVIEEEVAMETYLRAYQHAIDVGAGGFMCSYNQVQFLRKGQSDGSHAYACGSEALLNLLRKSLGYGGLLMSDWGAQFLNYTADGRNHSGRKFSEWEMVWSANHTGIQFPLGNDEEKHVAIERALAGLYLSGVMPSIDGKAPTPAPQPEQTLPQEYLASMSGDGDKFEVQLVAETLTLLKNDATLPIQSANKKILLLGEAMLTGGGSGEAPAFAYLFPNHSIEGKSNNGGLHAQRLMKQALADALHTTVSWDFDLATFSEDHTQINFSSFDYIIAFGSQYRSEAYQAGEKDGYYEIGRCSSTLNVSQVASSSEMNADYYGDCDYPAVINMLAEARGTGTKVISVTSVGGVFAAYDFIENVDAAITTYYPGQYFASGLAAVLSGSISPGGKLTQTLPRLESLNGVQYIQSPVGRFNAGLKVPSEHCVKGSASDCLRGARTTLHAPAKMWDHDAEDFSNVVQYGSESSTYSEGALVGYKYYEKHDMTPLFPFGFGLSYGKWQVSVDFGQCHNIGSCKVTTDVILEHYPTKTVVSNVVQVYLGYRPATRGSSVRTYPVKELAGFRKVWGSTKVSLDVQFNTAWDHVRKVWTTPCNRDDAPGVFTISVGYSSADIAASHEITCPFQDGLADPCASPDPCATKLDSTDEIVGTEKNGAISPAWMFFFVGVLGVLGVFAILVLRMRHSGTQFDKLASDSEASC